VGLVAGAAFWFLKDDVHFLMGYQGTVVRAFREDVSNASTGGVLSDTLLEVETAAGRITLKVPHNVYVDAKPGKSIIKRRFSNRVIIQ
jgi:hypothetical protein